MRPPARRGPALPATLWAVAFAALLGGCRQDMHDQPRLEPMEASSFFADGQASRAPVAGTVARGQLGRDDVLHRGIDPDGELVAEVPLAMSRDLLGRGRERYDIFCSPCHGRLGDGRGMIVRRGFKRPQTFHQDRLREAPAGYFFDVITNGFGEMSSYAAQVPVEDRWAITAYVRALQLSQNVSLNRLESEDLAVLEELADGGEAAP